MEKTRRNIIRGYAFIMFLIFPFFCTDRYFNILHDRTYFLWVSTLILFVSAGVLSLLCLRSGSFEFRRPGLSVPDIAALLFFFFSLFSSLLSDNLAECIVGESGRFHGLISLGCYVLVYFILRSFVKLDRRIIYAFLIGGLISALWGLFDFLGMDIFGWISAIKEEMRGDYISSYGNINTYSHAMSIFFSFSGSLFLLCDKKKKAELGSSGFYLSSFLIFCIGLLAGRSDSSLIAIGSFFVFVFFFALEGDKYPKKAFILFKTAVGGFAITGILARLNTNPLVSMDDSLLLKVCSSPIFTFFVLAILFLDYLRDRRFPEAVVPEAFILKIKPFLKTVFFAGAGMVLMFFFAANTTEAGKDTVFYISDTWGTYRGYIWKKSMAEFMEWPILKKLFGSGPEMFKTIMVGKYREEMKALLGQVFDSPHCEPLQMLFTTGILGFSSYYIWQIGCCVKGLKKYREEPWVCSIAISILVYLAVSFVNISTPITGGIVIVLLGLCSSKASEFK